MKLRIQNNSVRFRLTRTEVDTLGADGRVSAVVAFPDGSQLEYALETSSLSGQPRASYANDRIVVQIPQAAARHWVATEEVSISATQALEDGALSILVEKDFACLTPREGENEADLFPHPRKGQETC